MDEPEVTGGGVEDSGEDDDEKMMTAQPKVRGEYEVVYIAVVSDVMFVVFYRLRFIDFCVL